MKLFGMAAALKERLSRSDHQDLTKADLLGLLVEASGSTVKTASSPHG
jgi:hypothetical protein